MSLLKTLDSASKPLLCVSVACRFLPDLHAGVVFLLQSMSGLSPSARYQYLHHTYSDTTHQKSHRRTLNTLGALTFNRLGINNSLSCTMTHTHCHTHTLSHRDTVSITQYFRCQSCVVCHALRVVVVWGGAGWQQRTGGGTLPDEAVTPFNTSAQPVISSYVCVCELLA